MRRVAVVLVGEESPGSLRPMAPETPAMTSFEQREGDEELAHEARVKRRRT